MLGHLEAGASLVDIPLSYNWTTWKLYLYSA
jgi:hypothetical protein